jgi:3-methyladenine DNA glycosylase AlkD
MPVIRRVLHAWYRESIEGQVEVTDRVELALGLFAGRFTEEKLAGTLFLQEILIPTGALTPDRHIPRFAELFDQGRIFDWNVCDWFCVKVLGRLVQAQGGPWADPVARWRDAENLWRARASLVPFVTVARDDAYYPLIAKSCQALIQRPERFAKTAVGWILRDISKSDESFVRKVLEAHLAHFSVESLRNATKYFGPDETKRYIQRARTARSKAR